MSAFLTTRGIHHFNAQNTETNSGGNGPNYLAHLGGQPVYISKQYFLYIKMMARNCRLRIQNSFVSKVSATPEIQDGVQDGAVSRLLLRNSISS